MSPQEKWWAERLALVAVAAVVITVVRLVLS